MLNSLNARTTLTTAAVRWTAARAGAAQNRVLIARAAFVYTYARSGAAAYIYYVRRCNMRSRARIYVYMYAGIIIS